MKNLMNSIRSYWSNDEGLVTIEWVGIAAVVVIAGILIATATMGGAGGLGEQIASNMAAVDVTAVQAPTGADLGLTGGL